MTNVINIIKQANTLFHALLKTNPIQCQDGKNLLTFLENPVNMNAIANYGKHVEPPFSTATFFAVKKDAIESLKTWVNASCPSDYRLNIMGENVGNLWVYCIDPVSVLEQFLYQIGKFPMEIIAPYISKFFNNPYNLEWLQSIQHNPPYPNASLANDYEFATKIIKEWYILCKESGIYYDQGYPFIVMNLSLQNLLSWFQPDNM